MQVVSLAKCGEREEVEEKGKRRDEGLQFICSFLVLYYLVRRPLFILPSDFVHLHRN